MSTKRINGIDIFKFIFSICIIAIHSFTLHNGTIASAFVRTAVPFFFVVNGYFIYLSIEKS